MAKASVTEKGWKNMGPYKIHLGEKTELIWAEVISGIAVRTFEVYDVWELGTTYRRNNEVKRVKETTERTFKRRYFTGMTGCSYQFRFSSQLPR